LSPDSTLHISRQHTSTAPRAQQAHSHSTLAQHHQKQSTTQAGERRDQEEEEEQYLVALLGNGCARWRSSPGGWPEMRRSPEEGGIGRSSCRSGGQSWPPERERAPLSLSMNGFW